MKIWINILAVIVFIAAISAGKVYWNNRVSEQSVSRPTKVKLPVMQVMQKLIGKRTLRTFQNLFKIKFKKLSKPKRR